MLFHFSSTSAISLPNLATWNAKRKLVVVIAEAIRTAGLSTRCLWLPWYLYCFVANIWNIYSSQLKLKQTSAKLPNWQPESATNAHLLIVLFLATKCPCLLLNLCLFLHQLNTISQNFLL